MIKTQFTMYLSNKPGTLARITKALSGAGINILGISIAETSDVSLVQVIVSNAGATRRILDDAHIHFSEQKVAILTMKDEPGALAEVASKLARKKLNINYLYATTPGRGSPDETSVVISTDDLSQVEEL